MHNLTSGSPDEVFGTSASVPGAKEFRPPPQWETVLAAVALLSSGLAILAHFALVPGGGWGGDEFANFARYQHFGIDWLAFRLLHWIPRPLSEVAIYLYSLAVAYWQTPLITPILSVMWTLLVGGTVAVAWQHHSPRILPRVTLALTLIAMFLLGHRIYDVFFWTLGTVPYLLNLLSITIVTFQVVAGGVSLPRVRLICGLALAVAATSWETGLFFTLAFTIALLLLELPALARRQLRVVRDCGWYLVPFVISLCMVALLSDIIQSSPARGLDQGGEYFRQFWPSLGATLLSMGPALLLGDESAAGLDGPASLAVAALLLVGFVWACRAGFGAPFPRRYMAALCAGLVGSFLLTIFATYYEHGAQANEAQTTLRECLVVLGLLAAARTIEQRLPRLPARWVLPRLLGPIALVGAVGIGMAERTPALIADYSLVPEIREAREQTWRSGLDPATTTLRYVVAPSGQILNGLIPSPPGHFVLGASDTEWWMTGLMDFFGKTGLEFTPLSATIAR